MAAMRPAAAAPTRAVQMITGIRLRSRSLGARRALFANELLPIARPAHEGRGERCGSFKCGGNEAPGVLGSRVLLSTPPKWGRAVGVGNIDDILPAS